jgi:crotonobetainyl-CoA:carnitine CoA-transferase CaiB-like acyl-CoA transferase
MTRAFSGLRVIDMTHVLAGPFASYQMAVLGADVIKVENPDDPDQSRYQGSDRALNDAGMGTAFMAQGSQKRTMAVDLRTPQGVEVMKKLVETADVFVENYRPDAFRKLGLGYEDVASINPGIVYCSISAYGKDGPRGHLTAYDNVIQAVAGMMAMNSHEDDGRPLKTGSPVVDFATGTTAAFAISAALYQRERNGGIGQHIDVSMLDVALILCNSHIAGHTWNGWHPEPKGNRFPFATLGAYEASDTLLMIAASNLRQQRRLWVALDRPDMIKTDNNQRLDGYDEEFALLTDIFRTRTADEWEVFLNRHRVPAARVRRMEEALADPQIAHRGFLHTHEDTKSMANGLCVPVSAFRLSESPAGISLAPQPVGANTDEILESIGYGRREIDAMRRSGAIN